MIPELMYFVILFFFMLHICFALVRSLHGWIDKIGQDSGPLLLELTVPAGCSARLSLGQKRRITVAAKGL